MNETIKNIMERRSVRKYSSQSIDQDILQEVIDAGRAAPSGGNNHTAHIYVITDEVILQELKKKVQKEFSKMEIEEGMYKSLKNTIQASKKGNYDFIYHAPCLIILTNLKDYGNAMADCVSIEENMMIAATSLGLGTCYINQLHWLDGKPSIMKYLHIPDKESITCSLAIGYPDSPILPRNNLAGNEVTFIDSTYLTLKKFIDSTGRVKQLPNLKNMDMRKLVYDYIAEGFEEDRIYTEKEVNEILKNYYDDYVLVRRELIENHLLDRTDTGSAYQKVKK